jgi:hypothetical protein
MLTSPSTHATWGRHGGLPLQGALAKILVRVNHSDVDIAVDPRRPRADTVVCPYKHDGTFALVGVDHRIDPRRSSGRRGGRVRVGVNHSDVDIAVDPRTRSRRGADPWTAGVPPAPDVKRAFRSGPEVRVPSACCDAANRAQRVKPAYKRAIQGTLTLARGVASRVQWAADLP